MKLCGPPLPNRCIASGVLALDSTLPVNMVLTVSSSLIVREAMAVYQLILPPFGATFDNVIGGD